MSDDRKRVVDNNDASRRERRNQTDDEAGEGLSSSRTGDRDRDDDMSDIGSTDEMTGSTGGLAGSSR